jgi:hypothetical protein
MQLIGCDVFIHAPGALEMPELPKQSGALRLELVSNRGTRLWPTSAARLDYLAEEWRYRFTSEGDKAIQQQEIHTLLKALTDAGRTWTRVQTLWTHADGSRAFSSPY